VRERRRVAIALFLGRSGRGVGFLATVVTLPFLYRFARGPVGTSMRAMGLAAILFLCAALGLLIVLPMSLLSLKLARRGHIPRRVARTALAFSLSAIFIGFVLFRKIGSVRHYVTEP